MPNVTSKLDADQQNRLLQHGIHEETIFYNRLNFFSVFEGILLAALVSLDSKAGSLPELVWLLPIFGMIITAIWWLAQFRKSRMVEVLGRRIEQELPEFRATIKCFADGETKAISANAVITHSIPAMFLVLWAYLLVRALVTH